MNKKFVIAIVIIVVVLLAIGAILVFSMLNANKVTPESVIIKFPEN